MRIRKTQLGIVGLLLLIPSFGATAQNIDTNLEYQVKSAYLLNFTKFVEWPESAYEDPTSPFTLCVMGEDPFGPALDRLVEGESVAGHKLEIQRIQEAPRPKLCQILFVSNSEKRASAAFEAAGPGVLTVGDNDSLIRQGAIIAFVIQGRHVRFDINLREATAAHLTLSSRLLAVARAVTR